MMKIRDASAVRSLMYAMVCTQPDIGYAVGVVNRFMSNLGREHWVVVKWIPERHPKRVRPIRFR